jgi:D-alanyl-D-alanine endopeptidase (penicillin-binding protein 7)
MAASWISSAQNGHFFIGKPSFRENSRRGYRRDTIDCMRCHVVWGLALVVAAVGARPAVADGDDDGDGDDRADATLPDVHSESAVVLDADTGTVLFRKAADEVRPIASTTKIFVAMVVRAHDLDLDGWTEITRTDASYARGGARTRLDVGETFRNKDLLRAMLMASDNRAPTALARAAGLDPDELVAGMNRLAKKLHLAHTRFSDPSGLRGNVSTAREMALALETALGDPVLREIMGDAEQEVVSKDGSAHVHYGTTNQALRAGKWDVIGGKTGYTEKAGYCFVTAARFDGKVVVAAFFGADGKATRFADFDRVATWLDRRAKR